MNPGPTQHARGIALMVLSTACFTANILLVRGLSEVEPVNLWLVSCVRFVAGMAVIFAGYRRQFEFAHLFRNPKLATRGLLGGAGVYLYYLTVIHLGAGRATFINNTYVIFGALMAVWVLGERFHAALAIGSFGALAGLGLLTNAFAAGSHVSIYDGIAVITALASAYVVVTIRQLHATEHTSTIFAAQCVYGLLICALPAALHPQAVSSTAWAMMTLAGLFAAVGQITMTRAFRELPVAEGSLLQMLVPVGIAAGGIIFFGERFVAREWVGAALILAGTMFTTVRRSAVA